MEAGIRRLKKNQTRGKRFHFAGSASKKSDEENLRYAHRLVRSLVNYVVSKGAGLVVTIGGDPSHDNDGCSTIFDWTILEEFARIGDTRDGWPYGSKSQLVGVGFSDWRDRVPPNKRRILREISESGKLDLVQMKPRRNVGGLLREFQASYGDVLVVLGGGPGTQHLADLYRMTNKPVIPLDLDLSSPFERKNVAQMLGNEAVENPRLFFGSAARGIAGLFSGLSLRDGLVEIPKFKDRFSKFFEQLPRPSAFFVRLQNKDHADFENVEWFFRNIVEKTVIELGFRKFEIGIESTSEQFLNVEIFTQLGQSSLVIIDVTGLRPNCFMEMGYAYGIGKKVILTARKGTRLPFDSASLPCFFWSKVKNIPVLTNSFGMFVRHNIDRGPLVRLNTNPEHSQPTSLIC